MLVLALAGLILSHNALAIMFLPFLLIFMILEMKLSKENLFWLGLGTMIAFGLTAFFWLPAMAELKFTLAQYYLSQKDFHEYFVPLKNLIYMPWGFTKEATPTYLGFVGVLTFILFLWHLVKKKINNLKGIFFIFSWIISLFLILSWSVFLWEKLPILPFFQTPWRFLSLTVLVTSLMLGWLVKTKPFPLFGLIITFLTIILALPAIQIWRQEKVNEEFYRTYPKSTTWHNEGSPIWTAGEADRFPEEPYQIIGKAQVLNWQRGDTQHLIKLSAQESIRFIDQTIFFPGWRVLIDKKPIPIQFQDPLYRGLITFDVPGGDHEIEIVFGRTKLRLMAELISVGSLIGLFFLIRSFKIKLEQQ